MYGKNVEVVSIAIWYHILFCWNLPIDPYPCTRLVAKRLVFYFDQEKNISNLSLLFCFFRIVQKKV